MIIKLWFYFRIRVLAVLENLDILKSFGKWPGKIMEIMEILKTLEISTMNTHFSSYVKLQKNHL